jgi:hypothetical protein
LPDLYVINAPHRLVGPAGAFRRFSSSVRLQGAAPVVRTPQ